MINHTHCLICGSQDSVVLLSYNEPDRYELAVEVSPIGYYRRWVQCSDCGLIYSVHPRAKGVFDKLYSSVYRNDKSPWRKESGEELFLKVINRLKTKRGHYGLMALATIQGRGYGSK